MCSNKVVEVSQGFQESLSKPTHASYCKTMDKIGLLQIQLTYSTPELYVVGTIQLNTMAV